MSIKRLSLASAVLGCLAALGAPAHALEKAQVQSLAQAGQSVEFDIYFPARHRAELDQLLIDQQTPGSVRYHQWLTPQEYQARFGLDTDTLSKVTGELQSRGLAVTETHASRVHVKASAGAVEQAFSTRLANARFAHGGQTMVATRPLAMPAALASLGAVVARLSPVIHVHTHSRKVAALGPSAGASSFHVDNRNSPTGGYWFDDLKQAYSYPSFKALNGKGATIGILMDADYKPSDMHDYFSHEKVLMPQISEVKVNGGAPFNADTGDSGETSLDIQQSGGMAPDAHIVLYNIPSLSDADIMAGLTRIVEDNQVDVVNMSFGGAELGDTAAYNGGSDFTGILQAEDDLFKQGNALGITFVASSGDEGSNSIPAEACFETGAKAGCGSYVTSVEFPASSPHVTGVGGTNLVTTATSGSLNSAYVRENADSDPFASDPLFGTPATGALWGSGGGKSIVFAKPSYQKLVNSPSKFRTVPDLALHMGGCPFGAVTPCGPDRSFDEAVVDGQLEGLIGTSAAAPDFAGLIALKVQHDGARQGNVNYAIYAMAAAQDANAGPTVFHTGIPGSNGAYKTTAKGYNLVLGNGTLYGTAFLGALGVPVAGPPQSSTNP